MSIHLVQSQNISQTGFDELNKLFKFSFSKRDVNELLNLNNRIKEIVETKTDYLIADLEANPEHQNVYDRMRANLNKKSLNSSVESAIVLEELNYSIRSTINLIQKIAKHLHDPHTREQEKISGRMNVYVHKLLQNYIYLELPKNLDEIRSISNPDIRATFLAALINRDFLSIKSLNLSKNELMQIGPHLTYLYCKDAFDDSWCSEDIHSFLDTCVNLDCLLINSDKITRLPALNSLELLDCNGCTNLNELPSLPALEKLSCRGCINLKEIPPLPNCKFVDCTRCPNLRKITSIPSCDTLYCRDCIILTELPTLYSCEIIDCTGCTMLSKLSDIFLPLLERFYCGDCKNLSELPKLHACNMLNCSGCINLNQLPNIYLCEVLKCNGCTNLRYLPLLYHCKILEYANCRTLDINSVPLRFRVDASVQEMDKEEQLLLKMDSA